MEMCQGIDGGSKSTQFVNPPFLSGSTINLYFVYALSYAKHYFLNNVVVSKNFHQDHIQRSMNTEFYG